MKPLIWCVSLSQLCERTLERARVSARMQILGTLPPNLQVSVLQAADVTLDTALSLLPASMQHSTMCAWFPSMHATQELHLCGSTLSPVAAHKALTTATQFPQLTSLHLSDVDVRGDASECGASSALHTAAAFAAVVAVLTALQKLSLLSCTLSDRTVAEVYKLPEQPLLRRLRRLSLADMHATHAARLLAALCVPQRAWLQHTWEAKACEVRQGVECAQPQEWPQCTRQGTAGAAPVAPPPPLTLTLQEVLVVDDARELARVLPQLFNLAELNISHCKLTERAATTLLPVLDPLPRLTRLSISHCAVEAVIAKRLIDTLFALPLLLRTSSAGPAFAVAPDPAGGLESAPAGGNTHAEHEYVTASADADAAGAGLFAESGEGLFAESDAAVFGAVTAASVMLPNLSRLQPALVRHDATYQCLMSVALALASRSALRMLLPRAGAARQLHTPPPANMGGTTVPEPLEALRMNTAGTLAPLVDTAALAAALVLLGSLTHLDVSHSGAFVHLRAGALAPLHGLRSLTLNTDLLDGSNAAALAGMHALRTLVLLSGRMHVEERCVRRIARALRGLRQLASLTLPEGLQVGAAEAMSLCVLLRGCNGLHALRLSVDTLRADADAATALAPALATLSALTSLELAAKEWARCAQLDALFSALAPHGTAALAHLDLVTHKRLRAGSARSLLASLARLPGVTSLSLRTTVDDAAAHEVAEGLAHLPGLQALTLVPHPFSQAGSRALAAALAPLSALTRLVLEYKGYNYHDAAALAASLAALRRLRHVDLWRCVFHDGGLRAIEAALAALSRLSFLDLGACDTQASAGAGLARALSANPGLQHLALRVTCAGGTHSASTLHAIADSLRTLSHLRHLELRPANRHRPAARSLAATLHGLTRLTFLSASHTDLADGGAAALGAALRGLTTLRCLYLMCCVAEEAQALALVPPLAALTALRDLHLGHSQFGERGAEALAAATARMHALERATFSGSRMGDAGVEALVAAVEAHPHLTCLDLSDVTPAALTIGALACQRPWIRP
jgi:hypothetical protein